MSLLNELEIHSSWEAFLTVERRIELESILSSVMCDKNVTPTDPAVALRFLQVNLNKVRVVWLGQDVYPQRGVATGRAFEVGTLINWYDPFRQASLRNIIRAIYKSTYEITSYKEIPLYSEIKKDIQTGAFPILKPKNWYDSLEEQGVLFLNTSFTCRVNEPNSHKQLWSQFSNAVLSYLGKHNPELIWFLWGREAQSYKEVIRLGVFYESRHPSRVSETYPDDFLKFKGFEETNNIINWLSY